MFEMLGGNWSFGDYFKEAIRWVRIAAEVLKLAKIVLYVTVFEGRYKETYKGLKGFEGDGRAVEEHRIIPRGIKDNFGKWRRYTSPYGLHGNTCWLQNKMEKSGIDKQMSNDRPE